MSPSIIVVLCLLGLSMSIPVEDSYDPQNFYQTGRLVGGTEAPKGYAPHMVALVWGEWLKSFSCGGILVSWNTVLTAAHCIDPMVSWNGQLLASFRGQIGSNLISSGYTKILFSGYENHPEWDSWNIKNDVGLLHVTEAVPKNSYAKPIPLNFEWVGGEERVHVTGWGRLSAWGTLPDSLQLLRVDTLSPKDCEEWVSKVNEQSPSPPVDEKVELCTLHELGAGQGFCNGDSGSALVDVNARAVGVVSWGWPCARGWPDVSARISGFEDFLRPAMARADDIIEDTEE